jgi:hypothetical protein
MKRAWRRKPGPRNDWKLLTIVLLVATAPVVGPVVLITVSTRPSMLYQTFSQATADGRGKPVDWSCLEQLAENESFAHRHQEMLNALVEVPGYMLPFDERPDEHGALSRFLLVPDPGNWLHPPHLDTGDVVVVNMAGRGKTFFYERKAVRVSGRLAREPLKSSRLQATLQMTATSVQLFGDSK